MCQVVLGNWVEDEGLVVPPYWPVLPLAVDNVGGLLVTIGKFSNQARSFADSNSSLRLIGGDALVDLILLHYEQLDSRYKGLIPLKKVYVPEAIEETEE